MYTRSKIFMYIFYACVYIIVNITQLHTYVLMFVYNYIYVCIYRFLFARLDIPTTGFRFCFVFLVFD